MSSGIRSVRLSLPNVKLYCHNVLVNQPNFNIIHKQHLKMGKCTKQTEEEKQCEKPCQRHNPCQKHRENSCEREGPTFTDQLYSTARDLMVKLQQTPAAIQEYSMPTLRRTELEAMKKTKTLMKIVEKRAKITACSLDERILELERRISAEEEECKKYEKEEECKKK